MAVVLESSIDGAHVNQARRVLDSMRSCQTTPVVHSSSLVAGAVQYSPRPPVSHYHRPTIISDIRPHACQGESEKPRHPATNGEQKGNPEASVARLLQNPGPS
jgi:hypothetical protein